MKVKDLQMISKHTVVKYARLLVGGGVLLQKTAGADSARAVLNELDTFPNLVYEKRKQVLFTKGQGAFSDYLTVRTLPLESSLMKKLKCVTSAPARLSVAMPLIFGLATIAAAPTVEAVTVDKVDILNGSVDVDENALINAADDLSNVALWCNDAAPVRVDIIDGAVDVNERGSVQGNDDLLDCDLTDEQGGSPTSNQVDIMNGLVDVDESGGITDDSGSNFILFRLP